MTHDDAREMLGALALDALSDEERAGVAHHVKTCDVCARELAELRTASELLAYAAPLEPFEAARCEPLKQRLLERAAAERAIRPIAPRRSDLAARRRPAPWLALAASLVLAAALGAYALQQRARANDLSAALASVRADVGRLRATLDSSERTMRTVLGPAVQIMELTAAGDRRPSGRMFWDQASDTWTLVAHDLPTPAPGRAYQLWLVDARDRRVSAGTFMPSAEGAAMVRATMRMPPDSLRMIAVTDEPEGGMPQPTGAIVLAGRSAR